MELYDAMRTTSSCRYFLDRPVDPSVLHRVFEHARFASSGGNRQGWRTIVVTDTELKRRVSELHSRQWQAYLGDARHGVVGFQHDTSERRMDSAEPAQRRLDRTDDFANSLAEVPVLLVCCIELWTLALTDAELERPSIVGGASLYTFVQNLLLGCRSEGLGSALTTLLAAEENAVGELLGLPDDVAVGALIAVGWPDEDKLLTKLTRKPVHEIVFDNLWGKPFEP